MIIATISILGITALAWLANRVRAFRVCPICAGVAGTWLWMLAARLLGYQIDPLVLAMLMGASVVGIAYQVEKRLPSSRSPLLWKTLFIPAGFVAAYSAISAWWAVFAIMTILLVILTLKFMEESHSRGVKSDTTVKELEKKMKNCC